MCIGAKKKSDLHPKGYWNGDDMHTKLNHVIAIFEITHPGKKARSSPTTASSSLV
jgi:hypothetical protein